MLKPALEALGAGPRLFDLAAFVVAYPLATASYTRLAGPRWGPSLDALGAGIVIALVLSATSAWLLQLHGNRLERSRFLEIARPVRTFGTVAVVLIAVAFLAKQHSHSRLLMALYFAFALALLVGARLGWGVVAIATQRGHASRYAIAGAGSNSPVSLREFALRESGEGAGRTGVMGEREIETRADRPPVGLVPQGDTFESASVPSRSAESLPGSELLLHGLRSCMDEISYTPGNPNVLSMTKYLPRDGVEHAARGRGEAGRAWDLVHHESGPSFSRTDDGDETVLRIEGVLDAITAPGVRPSIDALVAEGRRSITVDLSSLRLIDSSGVGLIVGLFKRCRAFGGTVRVSGLKDQPLAIFRLLRLDAIFPLP